MEDDLPSSRLDRAEYLQAMMITISRGGASDDGAYKRLRRELMDDASIQKVLPAFVRTCRDLSHFWSIIRPLEASYAGRAARIREAFGPLLDFLESTERSPSDGIVSTVLSTFDEEGVLAAWQKALERRSSDPEGAITAARSLLETVCKHVLDRASIAYSDDGDLNRLYRATTDHLNLSPNQHAEEAFKRILGGCTSVVDGLASLRNKVGDAHGQGSRAVRPTSRHAQLAVNMAGAMATFIVETWVARQPEHSDGGAR